MDVGMIIVIILEFVAVIAGGLVFAAYIGEAIKCRRRRKLEGETTAALSRLRMPRDEYFAKLSERQKEARLRRNRTW